MADIQGSFYKLKNSVSHGMLIFSNSASVMTSAMMGDQEVIYAKGSSLSGTE